MNKIVLKWSLVATISSMLTAIGGIVSGITSQKAIAAAQPQPNTPDIPTDTSANADDNK